MSQSSNSSNSLYYYPQPITAGYSWSMPTLTVSGWCGPAPLTRGDRVRIREGYDGAGQVWFFVGKSNRKSGRVLVECIDLDTSDYHRDGFLADAIEPYPYAREERIERAIEDFEWLGEELDNDIARALLFAILEAGV